MQTLNTDKNNTNIVPLFAVGTFCLHLLTLLLLMFHGGMLQQVKRKSVPQTLVQLADGRVVTADAKNNLERDGETIRRFVGETMTLMFTWSQKQSSTLVWDVTSELLRNDFKREFTQSFNNFELESPEENVLVIQLQFYLENSSTLSDCQFGFQEKQNTAFAISRLMGQLYKSFNDGDTMQGIF